MKKNISWQKIGEDSATLSPAEALKHYTNLASQRPEEEIWAAFLRHLSVNGNKYSSLGITLPAQYNFSNEIVENTQVLLEEVNLNLKPEEIKEILDYQESQGNPKIVFEASKNRIGAILPERLVPEFQSKIQQLFDDSDSLLTDVPIDEQ